MEPKNASANTSASDANNETNIAADLANSLSTLSIDTDTTKTNTDTNVGPPLDKIVEAQTLPQQKIATSLK